MEYQNHYDTLPEVEIYAISAQDTERLSSLLTKEAAALIRSNEAEGLAIVEENEVRGAICVRISPMEEEVMELISLYVTPAYRRRALGGTMFLEALERGMEATNGLLQMVECSFSSASVEMEGFLRYAGFQIEAVPESAVWRFSLEQAAKGTIFQSQSGSAYGPVPLSSLSSAELRLLEQTLEKYNVAYLTGEELLEANQEISYVLFDPKNPSVLLACAIWSIDVNRELCLNQFFFVPSDHRAPAVVLNACLQSMQQKFPETTMLVVPTLTPSSARLAQQFAGMEEPAEHLCRAVLSTHI